MFTLKNVIIRILICCIGLWFITQITQAQNELYPESQPYKEGHLQVSELHKIYYAEFGTPTGEPILYVHGGPGGGVGKISHRLMDPKYYHIIMIEQRGAMRSQPFLETKENTPEHLVEDFEKLRQYLQIDKWILLGGSWGSALSLIYAETHPDKINGLILYGIFLGTMEEVKKLIYGTKNIFPEYWEEFNNFIPAEERSDLITAYGKRILNNNDINTRNAAIEALDKHCARPANILPFKASITQKSKLSSTTLFIYYAMNDFFLKPNQIESNLKKIEGIPTCIIHGRCDMVTRVGSAYKLHKLLPKSELTIAEGTGHSETEPGIATTIIRATKKFKLLISSL